MKKIAIISYEDRCVSSGDYENYSEFNYIISRNITDWEEVTDKEYCEIKDALRLLKAKNIRYLLITKEDTNDLIIKSIKEAKEVAKRREKEREEHRIKAEQEKIKKEELKKKAKIAKAKKILEAAGEI